MRAPNLQGRQGVRRQAHVLHTACHDDVRVACHDGLGAADDRPKTGRADLVHRIGVRLLWHAAVNGGLPRGVLAESCLEHVAHDDFVDGDLFQ